MKAFSWVTRSARRRSRKAYTYWVAFLNTVLLICKCHELWGLPPSDLPWCDDELRQLQPSLAWHKV